MVIDFTRNEAILTNRAASYIQLKKYKEALFDCEQALLQNKTFVKAHQRAYKCYLTLGDLDRAFFSLTQAKELGDTTANAQIQVLKTVISSFLREHSRLVNRYGEVDQGLAGLALEVLRRLRLQQPAAQPLH